MKQLITAILMWTLFAFASIATQAQAEIQEGSIELPVAGAAYNACTGEYILLQGNVRYSITWIYDAGGNVHARVDYEYFDMTVVGQSSGDAYRLISQVQGIVNVYPMVTMTEIQMFHFIGSRGDTLHISILQHMTVTPDNTIRTFFAVAFLGQDCGGPPIIERL